MAIKNPTSISWTDPTQFEDGSPFGASDFKAYELGVDEGSGPVPLLALPTALGVGTSPIPDEARSVKGRDLLIHLRTLDNYGQISEWSNGVTVRFTGRPLAPASLSGA